MNTTSTVLGVATKIAVAVLVVIKGLAIALLQAAVTLLKQVMTEAPKVAAQVKAGAKETELPEGITRLINKANEFTSKTTEWVENNRTTDDDTEIVVYVENKTAA